MEFVVAEVERCVDGFEGFKVDIDLFFLSLVRHDCSTINDKAIFGTLGVEFETLLGRRDGSQYGKTVDTRFDVGGGTVFVRKHFVDT